YALYASGSLEICSSSGSSLAIVGPVHADGSILSRCAGSRTISGTVLARDDISVSGGPATLAWAGGSAALPSLTSATMEANPAGVIAAYGGRVRVERGIGGILSNGRFQTAAVAGMGECLDGVGACQGRGRRFPS